MTVNDHDLEQLKRSHEAWERTVYRPSVAESPERQPAFVTGSYVAVRPLYGPEDVAGPQAEKIGFPGEFPYTRGIQPTMYRGRLWTMRQYAGFGTARESNARFHYLLSQGQTGLSVAFDLPTQIGYDSDAAIADGEVGRVGVAIDTLADMEILFREIPLSAVSTSMTINAPAAILLAMYIAVAERQGVSTRQITGTVQNDILKEYISRGTYIFPPKPSLRLVTDLFDFCAREVPRWNTISVSGYHIREAGSTAAQEVGFTLADGLEYVRSALEAGLELDAFAGQISFFFNAHNDLLEEVAKFRAARRLWARLMKERFGAKSPKSQMLRFHAQTGGSTLTAQQVDNNIVRVAIQALAAVLGGAQSLHTNSRDEALALPTEDSVRIALRTQQILAYETGVANTIDPLGGSYFVESLTERIEKEAEEYIRRIDEMGGMIAAIEAGFVQTEIQRSAYQHLRAVEGGETVVVGVNRYQTLEDQQPALLKIDARVQEEQVAFLQRVRAERSQSEVRNCLTALKAAAEGSGNLIPPILGSVRAYASIGEICDTLRTIFGEYQEKVTL